MFPSEARRRAAVRKLAEVAGDDIALFCIVDEHVHAVPYAEQETMRRRARAITRSLRTLAVVPVQPARIRPVDGRNHMESVLDYVLGQPEKHELPVHPALWSGGCLPDLVGARVVPGLRLRVQDCLPRFRPWMALRAVKLPSGTLEPMPIDRLALLGPAALADAACSALCTAPGASGKEQGAVMARRAACVLAREGGLSLGAMAAALGVSAHTARRLAREPLPPQARRAVLLWLALEQRVLQAGPRR